MIDCWVETVSPSMAALAACMITASGADLHLETPVLSIKRDNACVTVTTTNGTVRAKAGVVALGVNQLAGVTFETPLSGPKATAVEIGHGGRAFKIWAKVRDVPVGTLATGGGKGIEFAFAERTVADDIAMVVGFGVHSNKNRPGDHNWVTTEMAKFFPNSEVIAHDWHDWLNDPFARGAWVAVPVGVESSFTWKAWAPEGRLAFATSDIARENTGWFEGAVISGEDAAAAIASLL